jgi:alanine racemase
MDMITLDLTGLPEEPSVGDEVVLLGQQLWPAHESGAANAPPEGGAQPARHATVTAEEMATKVGTISYEITCGLTPRVPRVYV